MMSLMVPSWLKQCPSAFKCPSWMTDTAGVMDNEKEVTARRGTRLKSFIMWVMTLRDSVWLPQRGRIHDRLPENRLESVSRTVYAWTVLCLDSLCLTDRSKRIILPTPIKDLTKPHLSFRIKNGAKKQHRLRTRPRQG